MVRIFSLGISLLMLFLFFMPGTAICCDPPAVQLLQSRSNVLFLQSTDVGNSVVLDLTNRNFLNRRNVLFIENNPAVVVRERARKTTVIERRGLFGEKITTVINR